MGYIEGLLGGFMGRKREVEAENLRQAELANAREAEIYNSLIQSPDPDIRTLAITGLLTSAQGPKRKSGLRGWIGEMEQNPALGQIRTLVNTPVPVEDEGPEAYLARTQPSTMIGTPPSGTLAQPATAATQGGTLRPTQATPRVDETVVAQTAGRPPVDEIVTAPTGPAILTGRTRPREVFMSPEEATLRQYSARERGEILGVVDAYMSVGLSREEAVKRAIAERERARGLGAPYQAVAGKMPDGTEKMGVFDRTLGTYIDPVTRAPLEGFQPRTTTGSVSLGADRESIARELFGKRAADLTPEQQGIVNQRLLEFSGQRAGSVTTGRGEAAANIPLSTQQRFQATTDLSKQWTTATQQTNELKRQWAIMQTGLKRYDADPIGASQAVLVTFQKILDPDSVVRESEYERSPAGLSAKDWLRGMYERYKSGGVGVPKDVLAQMVKTAEAFVTDQNLQSALNTIQQRIYDTAVSYEIDPRLILGGNLPAQPGTSAATPAPAPVSPNVGTPPGGGSARGGSGGPAPASGSGPGSDWTMVNGVLHYKGKPY